MQVTCRVAVNYTVETSLRPSFEGFLGKSLHSEDGTRLAFDFVAALRDDLENGLSNQPAPRTIIPRKASIVIL